MVTRFFVTVLAVGMTLVGAAWAAGDSAASGTPTADRPSPNQDHTTSDPAPSGDGVLNGSDDDVIRNLDLIEKLDLLDTIDSLNALSATDTDEEAF